MKENLVLIFTRNPELGKVKTRLAATIGDKNALDIYNYLLNHTQEIISKIDATRRVLYSEEINKNDIWDNDLYQKQTQFGTHLGARMKNAFADGFADDFKKIVIIGTDLHDLEASDIENAFSELEKNDVVIGPAEDGGYYLLGLKFIPNGIFSNKNWGTNSVLSATLSDLENFNICLLKTKNDIDTFEDIMNIEEFKKYIK
jgi:uncharacterized protein